MLEYMRAQTDVMKKDFDGTLGYRGKFVTLSFHDLMLALFAETPK